MVYQRTIINRKLRGELTMNRYYFTFCSELEGDIKLAFSVSQGKVVVDIIGANGLPLTPVGVEPGM